MALDMARHGLSHDFKPLFMLTGHDRHTQQSSCQLDVNRQADQGSNRVTERNPEALAAEWEQCPAEQSADTAISHLFEDERELRECSSTSASLGYLLCQCTASIDPTATP